MDQKYSSLGQIKRSYHGKYCDILIKCYGIGSNTAVSRANTLLIADTKVFSANTLLFWANTMVFWKIEWYFAKHSGI